MKKTLIHLQAIVTLLLAASVVVAGQPAVEGYRGPKAVNRALRGLAQSKHASYRSLARTLGGHDVGLLTIGTGKADKKPAVLIVSGVDPARLVDVEVTVRVAERLVRAARSNKKVRGLIDHITFHVIAQAAPDGSNAFFETPSWERGVNARPTDEDNDGQTDEDGPNDLNNDGLITVMRVKDESGAYKAHPDDERVLIEADKKKSERGRYSVYVEGRDDDGDGQLNEDPPGGVAFDRNFPFNYPYFKAGAGPHQVSEIETQTVADFAFDHPNIFLVWTLSDRDNLLDTWEPDPASEKKRIKTSLLSADAPYFNRFAEIYKDIGESEASAEPSASRGAWVEWAYFHYGRWSLATVPWSIPEFDSEAEEQAEGNDVADAKKDGKHDRSRDESSGSRKPSQDKRGAAQLQALKWFEQRGVDGFVDWQPIEHPDLVSKQVEVGGFKPFLRWNPPAETLDELADKQYEFLLKLGDMPARVKISELKTEPLGSHVWRVTASVVNAGTLPTVSEMGRITGELQRLQVELDLPDGVALVTGYSRRTIGPLAGNGGREEEKWLLRDTTDKAPALTVRVWSPTIEDVERTVELRRDQE